MRGKMNNKEHRKALTTLVKEVTEKQILVYHYSKARQMVEMETTIQPDTSWNK